MTTAQGEAPGTELGVRWWIAMVASAIASGLLTWEETGSIVWALVVGLVVLGGVGGGVKIHRLRRPTGGAEPPLGLLSVLLSVATALGVIGAFSCVAGCGASAWQKAATATAIAAVEVDRATSETYRTTGEAAIARVEAHDGTLEEWCELVAPSWERAQRIECAARALADLALSAQAILDIGAEPGPEWAGSVCGVVTATVEVWGQVETPPSALATVRGLACALAGEYRAPDPDCPIDPVPPGCEEE